MVLCPGAAIEPHNITTTHFAGRSGIKGTTVGGGGWEESVARSSTKNTDYVDTKHADKCRLNKISLIERTTTTPNRSDKINEGSPPHPY